MPYIYDELGRDYLASIRYTDAAIEGLDFPIEEEALARQEADEALEDLINEEAETREAADDALDAAIDALEALVQELEEMIEAADIDDIVRLRTDVDGILESSLPAITTAYTAADQVLAGRITSTQTSVTTEASARAAADEDIQGQIDVQSTEVAELAETVETLDGLPSQLETLTGTLDDVIAETCQSHTYNLMPYLVGNTDFQVTAAIMVRTGSYARIKITCKAISGIDTPAGTIANVCAFQNLPSGLIPSNVPGIQTFDCYGTCIMRNTIWGDAGYTYMYIYPLNTTFWSGFEGDLVWDCFVRGESISRNAG